jgi:hypothetical protein
MKIDKNFNGLQAAATIRHIVEENANKKDGIERHLSGVIFLCHQNYLVKTGAPLITTESFFLLKRGIPILLSLKKNKIKGIKWDKVPSNPIYSQRILYEVSKIKSVKKASVQIKIEKQELLELRRNIQLNIEENKINDSLILREGIKYKDRIVQYSASREDMIPQIRKSRVLGLKRNWSY